MKKEEYIKRYGEAAYKKLLQQSRDWQAGHRKERNVSWREWCKANPEKVKANNRKTNRETGHKGGKYYKKRLIYNRTGLQAKRRYIRHKHYILYHTIKQATPNSQIHHEWLPGTAKYRGVALVETVAHRHGIIKVIKVLEGEITLFTEKEIGKEDNINSDGYLTQVRI